MSYILKALRKSEKERQQNREQTLDSRLQVQSRDNNENTGRLTFWLILLLLLNVGVLGYFILDPFNSAPGDEPKTMASGEALPAGKTQADPVQAAAPAPVDEKISPRPPPVSADKTLSIADLSRRIKNAAKPSAVQSKPQQEVSIPPQQTPQPAAPVPGEVEIPEPVAMMTESKPETRSETEPAMETEPEPDTIPWLEDLPLQFRRNVPTLKINMHVYSKIPENRFVLVSMQKFLIDQEISADMMLKDILPDGIVVSYQGRTFKIRRQ